MTNRQLASRVGDTSGLGAIVSTLEAVVDGRESGRRRVLLGIAGQPGSGKTTLAEALRTAYAQCRGDDRVAHLPMDGFHLADAQLSRLGLLDRKGAPDTFDASGYVALLRRVATETDRPIYAPGFERDLEQPIAQALVIPPTAELVITEGNYLLLQEDPWRELTNLLDEIWYVSTQPRLRRERLVARHIHFGKAPAAARAWVDRVDEPNAVLVEADHDRAMRTISEIGDGWRLGQPGC